MTLERRSSLRLWSGTGRVWLLTAGIVGAALGLYLTSVRHVPHLREPGPPLDLLGWWALVVPFFFAERYVVHLQFRHDAHSFSLTEIPLVLSLFLLSPTELMAAQLVGGALALLARRQPPVKFGFNLANLSLNAAIAIGIFTSLANLQEPQSTQTLAAAFVAALAWGVITPVLINCAIYLSGGGLPRKAWSRTLFIAGLVAATNTSLALAGVTIAETNLSATWVLLLPTIGLLFISRFYALTRQQHESVEFLYQSTRILHRSLRMDSAMLALLSQAREMFRCEIAEIILLPSSEKETALSTVLGPGDSLQALKPIELDPTEGVWARVASEAESILLRRPIENERLREHFAERQIRDAMVAPLYGDQQVLGTMMVANRMGQVSTFDTEDLKLFETLANHASVALRNARLVGRLEESLVQLEEMNELKDDFVASVSHELRTPLTSIQAYVSTLLRHWDKIDRERGQSFLEEVERQSHHLRRLIEDLLAVSRLEARQDRPQLTTVDIPPLVRQVVGDLKIQTHDHSFELQFGEDLPPVETDDCKARQILTNLVENAIKYAPPKTKIMIMAHKSDSGVVVSVQDQGRGIPAHLREQIFERFYQVDQSATRASGGTGLGLYICRKLAEVIGGRVWLERSDENGSLFSLWIPQGTRIPPLSKDPDRVLQFRRIESA